jgi:sialic acid synthase
MKIRIGSKFVGDGCPCYIIAEIGLNHNGRRDLARQLVDEAVRAGADAVKFQKRNIDELLIREWLDKPYSGRNSFGATYGEHRRNLELPDDAWYELSDYCQKKQIDLLASGWDIDSVEFLEKLPVPAFKIASADLSNIPLLEHVAGYGKPVLLSTGMSSLEEIDEAVEILRDRRVEFILLQCVSAYPFDDQYANLKVIPALRERYGVPVGYSGHEKSGHVITLGAVALGACLVERHFTLDHTMPGPDHAASLEPLGFASLVQSIRKLESAMGSSTKEILDIEIPVREKLAKSVVARRAIPSGHRITREDLTVKSPGTGIRPREIPRLIGKVARKAIPSDTLIPDEALQW